MKLKVVQILLWLMYRLDDLLERVDHCHICGQRGEHWCVECGLRHCPKHESGFYSDATLCLKCRSSVSIEEEADLFQSANLHEVMPRQVNEYHMTVV